MSTYVLWDIDGTLIRNTPTTEDIYLDAVEHVTGARPTRRVPDPHGMTEGQLLAEILRLNELGTERLEEVLYDFDVISRDHVERGWEHDQCAGAEEALEAVSARGWTNALLTGNVPDRARYKLLTASLDPGLFDWEHSYFGYESPARNHHTARTSAATEGNTSVVVGDTPNDGLTADSAGLPFIAVATGIYSAEALGGSKAVTILEDLESGLGMLLSAVEAASTGPAVGSEPTDGAGPADGAEPADAVSP